MMMESGVVVFERKDKYNDKEEQCQLSSLGYLYLKKIYNMYEV
jgi:hypothetical protein